MAGDCVEGRYQLILIPYPVLISMRCPLRVFRILDPYLCGLINNRGEKSTLIQSGMKCNRVHLGKNSIYIIIFVIFEIPNFNFYQHIIINPLTSIFNV